MSETEVKAKAPKAPKAPKEKKIGVGAIATQLIRDGDTNEVVLEKVRTQFPDAKTTLSSINWYRNKLRAAGPDSGVKTVRELKKEAAAAAAVDPLA